MDYRLRDLAPEALAGALVAGLERPAGEAGEGADLFWLPPVPNYFFQRDPLVVAADRTIRCSMATPARAREPLLSGYVFRYHPRLGRGDDAFWFDEFPTDYARPTSYARMRPTLEGGDVLILREDLLVIGYSETTEKDLLAALKSQKLDLKPILCGGSDPIAQRREQWTDGANAFALAPGVILTYDRNEKTAEELAKAGYAVVDEADLLLGRETLELKKPRRYVVRLAAHELSRARGGPRCMAMPLVREPVA